MKLLKLIPSQLLPLKSLKPNTGQIPGLPANLRDGYWFFQHFHDMQDVLRITRRDIGEPSVICSRGSRHKSFDCELNGTSFQVAVCNRCPCTIDELSEAVRFEFTLPLPGGRRYNYFDKVWHILETLM